MRGDDTRPDDSRLTAAVQAAQDGDEAAFRIVYRMVQPRLLAYVRTLVGEADAEDVASEAWLQIARDLDRFTGDADRFRGWAARIARNRSLDHIRTRGRRPAVGGDDSELADRPSPSDTAGAAMEALGTREAMRLIARLPADQAEAVTLRVIVGLDARGAAEVLGKRPGAVRTSAHRGLRRLARMLDAGGDDAEGGRSDGEDGGGRSGAGNQGAGVGDGETPAATDPGSTFTGPGTATVGPATAPTSRGAGPAAGGTPSTAGGTASAPGKDATVGAEGASVPRTTTDPAQGAEHRGTVPAQRRRGPAGTAGSCVPGVTDTAARTQKGM
ncbi:sigma-70 family RNA polymerase sigma factor [Streptomyces sp. NPDC059740]|uniref:RNA polymerase sigma factor n=1 Tax=Streptomyces sp. NPDC059740 TaxID=3346926 RepID=UPI00364F6D1A